MDTVSSCLFSISLWEWMIYIQIFFFVSCLLQMYHKGSNSYHSITQYAQMFVYNILLPWVTILLYVLDIMFNFGKLRYCARSLWHFSNPKCVDSTLSIQPYQFMIHTTLYDFVVIIWRILQWKTMIPKQKLNREIFENLHVKGGVGMIRCDHLKWIWSKSDHNYCANPKIKMLKYPLDCLGEVKQSHLWSHLISECHTCLTQTFCRRSKGTSYFLLVTLSNLFSNAKRTKQDQIPMGFMTYEIFCLLLSSIGQIFIFDASQIRMHHLFGTESIRSCQQRKTHSRAKQWCNINNYCSTIFLCIRKKLWNFVDDSYFYICCIQIWSIFHFFSCQTCILTYNHVLHSQFSKQNSWCMTHWLFITFKI